MNINIKLNTFKKKHKLKKNQIIFHKANCQSYKAVENLINKFLNKKNSFIFESVEKRRVRGRYTIIGADPDKIWDFEKNKIKLTEKNKTKIIKESPYLFLRKLIENFSFPLPKNIPSICSLLVGYFSYDIIRYIEKIPNKCIDDLKIPDIRMLRPRTVIIYDNLLKKIYFIKNCFADEKIYNYKKFFLYQFNDIKNIKELAFSTSYKKNPKKIKIIKSSVKSNISKNKFKEIVLKAKKYIKKGDIFQVVLSQRFETKLTKTPLEIYKKLRVSNPSPFMFFFNFNDFQIIGSSPEILVRLRDNKITIRPIAGTRPRGKNSKEDKFYKNQLLNDKKELSEHLMLLDLGRNDTGKVSKINSVKVTEQFKIEKYSHVMHIVSNVEGDFNKKHSLLDTMLAGFPAGTVTGAPKIRAMEIIDELEKSKRKMYAGSIGYFSADKNFDTCITLRTALIKNNKFYVQSGAGIVADSVPEKEYVETVNKAKALIASLN
jgi:anthranilate synthase component 1|tara:strand:+ start:877 stop:2340 length:1464 start_codon:yes stop_codon:yes gene_type:complete